MCIDPAERPTVLRPSPLKHRELPLGRPSSFAQIVIYGNLKPALLSKVQVYAVAPWRRQIGINTMYCKKRYLRHIKVIVRGCRAHVTRWDRFEQERRRVFWPLVTALGGSLMPGRAALLAGLVVATLWLAGFPYVRMEYA